MRERPRTFKLFLWTIALLPACRGEPASSLAPARSTGGPTVASAPPAPASAPSASLSPPVPAAPASALPSASASAAPPSAAAALDQDPPLLDESGSPLPQTEERPSVTSARFQRRMKELAEAIRSDDPDRGRATFFPLLAYQQVKDVQKPERDYRYRLMAHFERDVHEYHKALGKGAAEAEFLGVEVPEQQAQWMKPGREGNRVGYYRVLRSKLRFRLAGGSERSLELTSMISWRGEWYVVHLHGFE